MSTSILYHCFGIKHYDYIKTEYKNGKIIFHLEKKRMKQCCTNCGELYDIIYKGRVNREIKTLPIGNKEVILSLHLHRIHCKKCGKTLLEKLLVSPPYKHWSYTLARYVIDLLKFSTIKDVADHLHLSWDTVKDIHYQSLNHRFKKRRIKHLRYLGIDEIAVKKGHDYFTIVVDLDSGQVVWVGEGRTADSLKPFLIRLQKAQVGIKAIAMDMWPAYYGAVIEYLPSAKVVFDRYHIMADLNRRLDKIRTIEASQALIIDKNAYKGVRYLLLSGQEKIADQKQAQDKLDRLFSINKTLNIAYLLKEELRELWHCSNRQDAKKFIENWIMKVYASGILQLMKFANTIKGHLSGVLNYFDYNITTGPVEGINNKIKVLKRKAYGYRDFRYFKLRIYFLNEARYELIG